MYNFFGGKFYPILHGVFCGLAFFAVCMFILQPPLSIVIGLIAAGLGGYQCKRMKKLQAFILASQLGLMTSFVINVVLLTWWNTSLYVSYAMMFACAVFGGWFGMLHAKDTIVFCTAVVGSGYITSGVLGLMGYNFGRAFDWTFFVGIGSMAGLIYAGKEFQHKKNYHEIKHDHGDVACEDEHADGFKKQKDHV